LRYSRDELAASIDIVVNSFLVMFFLFCVDVFAASRIYSWMLVSVAVYWNWFNPTPPGMDLDPRRWKFLWCGLKRFSMIKLFPLPKICSNRQPVRTKFDW